MKDVRESYGHACFSAVLVSACINCALSSTDAGMSAILVVGAILLIVVFVSRVWRQSAGGE